MLARHEVPERTKAKGGAAGSIIRRMAAGGKSAQAELVLDYVLVTGVLADFTFQGDTTYQVTNSVFLFGTTTLEGGAVIKYSSAPSGTPILMLEGPLKCLTRAYRPAVFTSSDDNSVGATIAGSSGVPVPSQRTFYLYGDDLGGEANEWLLKDVRMAYAYRGFYGLEGTNATLQNCQFLYCTNAVLGNNIKLQNCLFSGCAYPVYGALRVRAENVTSVGHTNFAQSIGTLSSLAVTNSIATGYGAWVGGSGTLPIPVLDHTTNVVNGGGLFQTVGGAGFYLATNSPCRNAGTTAIDSTLLSALRSKTTYPPVVYSNTTITATTSFSPQAQRDTDLPDLGYHYEPIDYVFGGVDANNNVTFTAGTVAAWFRTTSGWQHAGQGIHLADSRQVTFDGRVDAPTYWVRYNTVQESVNNLWAGGFGPGGITSWALTRAAAATVQARFLRASVLGDEGGSVNHFRDDYGYLIVRASHSEFWSGGLGAYVSSHYHTNCLFDRTWVWLENGQTDNEYIFRNCTFHGNMLSLQRTVANYLSVKDCVFDSTLFPWTDSFVSNTNITDYGYNAFLSGFLMTNRPSGPGDLFATNFNWQTSWLGGYYLPTNSPLINTGLVAAGIRGLYHFTTQTDQSKEASSQVDRGYHYVALDANGNPIDTDEDGTSDYLEDVNGNGILDDGESAWAIPPSIVSQPTGQTVIEGATVAFSVTAAGTAPLAYQWRRDLVNIPGATNATLIITNTTGGDAGDYTVRVSSPHGATNSTAATLGVVVHPEISVQPSNQGVTRSASATFSVSATGTGPLRYQWLFNGVKIPGSAASSYTRANVQAADAGNYSVLVANAAGVATSRNAVLSVGIPPYIDSQPRDQMVDRGSNATFRVYAQGTTPLTYQWTFQGVNIAGATQSSYTRSNVQPRVRGTMRSLSVIASEPSSASTPR